MTENEFSKDLAFRWVVEHDFSDPMFGGTTVTILGIYKTEEKANKHAEWIKEEDPVHKHQIRVYRIIYEE